MSNQLIQRLLTFLLIAMFATQTFAAAFDAHQSHQPEGVHIKLDDSHSEHAEHQVSAKSQVNSNIQNDSELLLSYDCHHCCHCHGSTPVYTLLKDNQYYPYHRDIKATPVAVNFSSLATSPDHRPPIV